MARPVFCMPYYLDTYWKYLMIIKQAINWLVSSVKVGNERLYMKYIQLPIPGFHLRNLSRGGKIHTGYNFYIMTFVYLHISRCIIFFHREMSYLSWSYVKSKKFKVQAQFLSRMYSNCFKCVQQVSGMSTASRSYHRKPAPWTDDLLYWSLQRSGLRR